MENETNSAVEGSDSTKAFFYSIADLPAESITEMLEQGANTEEEKQTLYDLLGRELLTKTILQSPSLSMFHSVAKPGERVKPHRHGTHQITYVLRGSLHYGNRVTEAGMGYFSPDRYYSWMAGDEGAEWLEIHSGLPDVYTPNGHVPFAPPQSVEASG
jgi:hypothetical protein